MEETCKQIVNEQNQLNDILKTQNNEDSKTTVAVRFSGKQEKRKKRRNIVDGGICFY